MTSELESPLASSQARAALPLMLSVAVATWLQVTGAHAQEEVPAPDDTGEVENEEALSLIADAVAEYGAGRYAEALVLFRRAHAIQPSARTLRGMGMAAFETRDYVAARRALRAALDEETRALTEDQRTHVEGLLGRAARYFGSYQIQLTPEEATLLVDGQPASLEADGVLLLNLGSHELSARCPTCEPWTRRIVVEGGEQSVLRVAVPVRVPEPSPPTEEAPSPPSVPPTRAEEDGGPPLGSILLFGAAGLLVAGSALTGVLALSAQSELEDSCPMSVCTADDSRDTADRAETLALVTDILWATGAAAAVGAVLLWLFDSPAEAEAEPVRVGAGCTGQGCGLGLEVALR